MKTLKNCMIGLLVVSIMGLSLPRQSYSSETKSSAGKENKTITRHEPKIMSTSPEDITLAMGGGSGSKWLWIGLGAVLLGGLAAAAGGGSSSGGGPGPAGDKGSLTVNW